MTQKRTVLRAELAHKVLEGSITTYLERNTGELLSIDQITEAINKEQVAPVESSHIIQFMQQFVRQGHVRPIETDDGKSRFLPVSEDYYDKFAGLGADAHKIYNVIEKAGSLGIWRRDLKSKVSLTDAQLATIVKDLESRNLIKETPSIHDKKRKVYILFDITPSAEVTGGIWYQDQQFNTPLIESLIKFATQHVNEYYKNNSTGLVHHDLRRAILNSGIGNISLTETEIDQVISATLCSGSIIKLENAYYPITQKIINPVSRLPCSGCSLRSVCSPDGEINPVSCPYLMKISETF